MLCFFFYLFISVVFLFFFFKLFFYLNYVVCFVYFWPINFLRFKIFFYDVFKLRDNLNNKTFFPSFPSISSINHPPTYPFTPSFVEAYGNWRWNIGLKFQSSFSFIFVHCELYFSCDVGDDDEKENQIEEEESLIDKCEAYLL